MDDEQSRRVDVLLRLYQEQMEHFRHTQDIEWKANFGIWTLLAAAIYMTSKEHVQLPHVAVVKAALFAAPVVHAGWLFMVHRSQGADKYLWARYRLAALRVIHGGDYIPEKHEIPRERPLWKEFLWLILETGITALLCMFLFHVHPSGTQ
jgi:hypothetical protein